MYKEIFFEPTNWNEYLHFIQEAQKRYGEILAEDESKNNDMRDIQHSMMFFVIFCENRLLNFHTLVYYNGIIMRNDDTAKEHKRSKSIGRILETVPKSYHAGVHLLMKHLLDKAKPTRINCNDDGIITIDDNVVKDSNIAILINDIMRKRKTTKTAGRAQFAWLLRVLSIISVLVGIKELLTATDSFLNIL